MILIKVPLDDLPACMDASSHLKRFIKATFFDESSRLSKISEINATFNNLLRNPRREDHTGPLKARTLLKFSELDVNCRVNGTPLLSVAIARRKYWTASFMLEREDLDVNADDAANGGKPTSSTQPSWPR